MVKVKILIPFIDKETGKFYEKVGDVIELTPKRFNEITSKGKFIQLVEDEPTKKESK